MTDKSRILDRSPIESQWKTLHHAWDRVEDKDGLRIWRKTCRLFDAFIEEYEPNRFCFEITGADGAGIFRQEMGVASFERAAYEGNKLIWEFLTIGIEVLAGIRISLDRPHNEVRFKSMVLQHSILHGLDEEGVLYREEEVNDPLVHNRKKKVWAKLSMERYEPKTKD